MYSISSLKYLALLHGFCFEHSKHQTPHDMNSIFEQTNENRKINGEILLSLSPSPPLPYTLVWLSKEKGKNQLHLNGGIHHKHAFAALLC
jgi:hypothetical protein